VAQTTRTNTTDIRRVLVRRGEQEVHERAARRKKNAARRLADF
jgi:hypothetical protein